MRKYQLFICLILSWQMSNAQIRVAEKNKIPNIDYEIVGNNLRLFGECSDSLKILKSINSLGFQSKMQCIKIYPFRLYRSILFNEVSFKETLFSQKINFSGCTFLMKSNFYYSNFFKDVIFMFSEFKNEVEFSTSKFQNSALFSNSLFNDKANFLSINFNKESGFDNSIFRKVLDFSGSKFDKESDFQGCKFYGNVYFSGCTFLDKINFNNSQFASKANFYYSSFKEAPDFDLVQLPDTLIFTYVNLKNCQEPIRFDFALTDSLQKRNAKNKKCKIFLDNLTDLNKVVLDASKFELSFDKNQNYDKKAGVFEQVIKKCKEMGFQDSEKGFNIEYQKLQLHYKYPIIGSPLILLNEYWWNFGYERAGCYPFLLFSLSLAWPRRKKLLNKRHHLRQTGWCLLPLLFTRAPWLDHLFALRQNEMR